MPPARKVLPFLVPVALLAVATIAVAAAPETTPPPGTEVPVPEPSEQAMDYYASGNVLWVINQLWGLLVPAAILFTGFSARMRDVAARFAKRWWTIVMAYFVLFSLFSYVVDLPLAYYSGFVRPHAYGLSDQAFGKWIGDSLKGLAIGLVMGSLLIWIPFLALRKSPNRWWLWTSVVAVPLAIFMMMLVPIFISPLFNDFGPMKDQALEAKILALAQQAGIEGSRVFEVNKSVDTNTVNAYVTGLGATKRIVLWDTIIAKLPERELLFVMGHEMGHYVLGHIKNGIAMVTLGIPTILFVAHKVSRWAIARYEDRFGFDQLSDAAALPLIMLVAGLFSFVVTPAMFAMTRYQEHEADRFGLEISQDNYACGSAFAILQQENLGNPRPGPLYKLWRATHPVLGDRIDFCNAYRPWEKGESLRYGELFGDE